MSDGVLSSAVEVLERGECVGMPTETVYGLAADALNPRAVARVFEVKQRPAFDPLIVHVTLEMEIEKWVSLSETARHLMSVFWPGPLTLIVPKTALISDLVTSGHSTVALRCPAHPLACDLLNAFGGPLVAPSANLFGQLSPTSADAVREGLGDGVELVLDGGACKVGLESTIVDCTAPLPQLPILRLGGVDPQELRDLGYQLSYPTPIIGQAPGTLKNHYAPRLPLYLHDSYSDLTAGSGQEIEPGRFAYLGWRDHRSEFGTSEVLSSRGDMVEAASRVFAVLRRLGQGDWEGIIAELPPERGLGMAIRDRLKRGSSGYTTVNSGAWQAPQSSSHHITSICSEPIE